HVRALDSTVLDAPIVEDRRVIAVVDQVLDRVGNRFFQRTSLDHGEAIGRNAAGLAGDLQLGVVLFDGVVGDRLVSPQYVYPSRQQGRGYFGLLFESTDLDVPHPCLG